MRMKGLLAAGVAGGAVRPLLSRTDLPLVRAGNNRNPWPPAAPDGAPRAVPPRGATRPDVPHARCAAPPSPLTQWSNA